MTAYHKDMTGFDLHVPLGYSPDELVMTATSDAMEWQDDDTNTILNFDLSAGAEIIDLGHVTAIKQFRLWVDDTNAAAFQLGVGAGTAFVVNASSGVIQLSDTANNFPLLANSNNVFRLGSVTNAQKTALTPVAGDLVYDSDDDVIYGYMGSSWTNLGGAGGGGGAISLSDNTDDQDIAVEGTNPYVNADTQNGAERLVLMRHDLQRRVDIGDVGSTADVNAALYFVAGSGSSTDYGRIEYHKDSYEGFVIYTHDSVEAGRIAAGWVSWGYQSSAHINYGVGIGRQSTCAQYAAAIGGLANAAGDYSFAAGYQATVSSSGDQSILIAPTSSSGNSGANSVGIGYAAQIGHDSALAVGRAATTTAANEAVFGSDSYPIQDWKLGAGDSCTTTASADVTFRNSEVTGTNAAGGDFLFYGGRGTGTGDPGLFSLYGALPVASGTGQHTYVPFLTFNGVSATVTNDDGGYIEYNTCYGSEGVSQQGNLEINGNGVQIHAVPYPFPSDCSGMLVVYAHARDPTAGESASYFLIAHFKIVSGTTTIIGGAPFTKTASEEGTASSWDCAVSAGGGGTVNIGCTGDTSNTTYWNIEWRLLLSSA